MFGDDLAPLSRPHAVEAEGASVGQPGMPAVAVPTAVGETESMAAEAEMAEREQPRSTEVGPPASVEGMAAVLAAEDEAMGNDGDGGDSSARDCNVEHEAPLEPAAAPAFAVGQL